MENDARAHLSVRVEQVSVLPHLFAHPFERIDEGLAFPGVEGWTPAWGIESGYRRGIDELAGQVRLLHRGPVGEPDAFILEFTPKGGQDRILLALVPGSRTLDGAWKDVEQRIGASEARRLRDEPVVKVPRIRIDLLREFGEILGAPLLNEGFGGYRIVQAYQSILFRLDESGAVLESESGIVASLSVEDERPDVFVFDRPFLVALIQKGAKEPHFLAWIANGDLIAK